jgi:thiosulfate/3-mercaptopyruvate sulfurtransferase
MQRSYRGRAGRYPHTVTELPGPVVDATWLASHEGETDLLVVDVRWGVEAGTEAAQAAFEGSHIPGAVFLDVDRDLAGRPFVDGPGRHPLPPPDVFAATMAAAGIGDGDLVVAYDDARGSLAARLWWMLDATGHRAAWLDGGVDVWAGELERGAPRPRDAATFTPKPWPLERIRDAAGVAEAMRAGRPVVDARAEERYRGETEPIDPVAGHVPGARNLPWEALLDDDGRLLPPEELRQRFEAAGVKRGEDAIVHCGSGITSCLTLVAMRHAGLGVGNLYGGSWSDWTHDPPRPVMVGADPGELDSESERPS